MAENRRAAAHGGGITWVQRAAGCEARLAWGARRGRSENCSGAGDAWLNRRAIYQKGPVILAAWFALKRVPGMTATACGSCLLMGAAAAGKAVAHACETLPGLGPPVRAEVSPREPSAALCGLRVLVHAHVGGEPVRAPTGTFAGPPAGQLTNHRFRAGDRSTWGQAVPMPIGPVGGMEILKPLRSPATIVARACLSSPAQRRCPSRLLQAAALIARG